MTPSRKQTKMCWGGFPSAQRGDGKLQTGSAHVPTLEYVASFCHAMDVMGMCPFSCQVPPSSTPSSTRASTSGTHTSAACLALGSISPRTRPKATSTCTGLVEARDVPPTKTAPATCATGETSFSSPVLVSVWKDGATRQHLRPNVTLSTHYYPNYVETEQVTTVDSRMLLCILNALDV